MRDCVSSIFISRTACCRKDLTERQFSHSAAWLLQILPELSTRKAKSTRQLDAVTEDNNIQVTVVVDSNKLAVTELPTRMLLPMCTIFEKYLYFSAKVKPTIVWDLELFWKCTTCHGYNLT